jgi:glutathione S-transferase
MLSDQRSKLLFMATPHLVLCELPASKIPRLESHSAECLKAHRALQLCGFTYERLHGERPDAFKRYNPAGQVPVLLIEGKPLSDSTRIVSRIDALSDGRLTQGMSHRERAEAYLWEEMADTVLVGFVEAARFVDDDNWPRTREAYFAHLPPLVRAFLPAMVRRRVRRKLVARDFIRPDVETCWARFEDTLDRLEMRAPGRGFWMGDRPSRADVAIFAPLWSLRTELTVRQARSIAARRRLSAWLLRVDAACASAGDVSAGDVSDFEEAAPAWEAGDAVVLRLAASFG